MQNRKSSDRFFLAAKVPEQIHQNMLVDHGCGHQNSTRGLVKTQYINIIPQNSECEASLSFIILRLKNLEELSHQCVPMPVISKF